MYITLIAIHVTVCLILIATILLQAGKGGGLTDMFGGGDAAQSVLGTQAPALLKKLTEGSAIAFLITSLVLGMVTARRGRSLFESTQMPAMPAMPGAPLMPGPKEPIAMPAAMIPQSADTPSSPAEVAPPAETVIPEAQ